MNKFACEMFGHFSYDESLTYQELLDLEAWIIGQVQLQLDSQGAEHIDFTPLGDELMVQCAFETHDRDLFHTLSQNFCQFLPPQMQGRLLFVDKHLSTLNIFYMTHQSWQENPLPIPSAREVLAAVPGKKKSSRSRKQ